MQTKQLATDAGRSRRTRALFVLTGWGLITWFVLRVAVLQRIGADVRAFQLAYVLGFAGYLILLWSVTRATRTICGGSWRWWLMGCVLARVVLLNTSPSDDVYRYVWEGRVQLAGMSPYLHPPDDPELIQLRDDDWTQINHPSFPAIYPPLAQLEFLLVAAVWPSVHAIKALHVLWDCLTIALIATCLRQTGRSPHRAIAYGLCPLVLCSFGVEGHLDSLMLLLIVVTVWAIQACRFSLGGAALGLAICVKPIAFVLWPWLLVRQRRAALITVGVIALCYLPYGRGGISGLSNLGRFAGMDEFLSALGTVGVTDFGTPLARAVAGFVVLAIIVWLARSRRTITRFAPAALEALILLLPVVHYWYVSWVLMWAPWRMRLRWAAVALAMVGYFEAEHARSLTGTWAMPRWVPVSIVGAFAAGWIADLLVARWNRRA